MHKYSHVRAVLDGLSQPSLSGHVVPSGALLVLRVIQVLRVYIPCVELLLRAIGREYFTSYL